MARLAVGGGVRCIHRDEIPVASICVAFQCVNYPVPGCGMTADGEHTYCDGKDRVLAHAKGWRALSGGCAPAEVDNARREAHGMRFRCPMALCACNWAGTIRRMPEEQE